MRDRRRCDAFTVTGNDLRIVRAGAERLAELAPVYRSLHEHHAVIAPMLAGLEPREHTASWERRRALYEQLLASPGAFLLLAESANEVIAYAVVSLGTGMQTWTSGDRIGDIHDIVVSPRQRGYGVGSMLLDEVDRELAGRHQRAAPDRDGSQPRRPAGSISAGAFS